MKRATILLLLFSAVFSIKAQETKPKFEISFKGFVNLQAFWDTRQNVEAREGMFTLYPQNEKLDADGVDINKGLSYNLLAMTSRLGIPLTGPDFLGAKTSALIETDFTGVHNDDNNGLRLRHAYINFEWKNRKLLLGQYWHPLDLPEFPTGTISLNMGAPFHSFARHHQVRFTQLAGPFELIAFAGMQRDYASEGPVGRTPNYQRQAAFPNLSGQFFFHSEHVHFGGVFDYLILRPKLSSKNNYIDPSLVKSMAASAFARFIFGKYELKFQSIWGQNLCDHSMMGGYAESFIDTSTGIIEYTTVDQFSTWLLFEKSKGAFRPALFAGYFSNLGSQNKIVGNFYGRLFDADKKEITSYIYRLAPRLTYWSGKTMVAAEFEYTVAAYGLPDTYFKVSDPKEIGNFRLLLGIFYFF